MTLPSMPRNAVLVLVAGAAVAVPALVVSHPPTIARPLPRRIAAVLPPRRIVPQAELPPVEPVQFVALAPEDAREFNATVPFSTAPNPAARPFRFAGTPEDRARATDCLAAGLVYEAGDDAVGERAVAQVVLNRLRHPAFPKTVCAVVFEGAERTTGCQFTFTCDGALTRWKPTEAAWKRARDVAAMALSGTVYRPVGYATHYHTDWVVPYWQSSLDKVAAVGSHLFFRWSGWWGTPPAFNRRVLTGEPVIAALASFSQAHGALAAVEPPLLLAGDVAAGTVTAEGLPTPTAADPETFLVALNPAAPADSYKALALKTCADRVRCVFMGWTDKTQTPAAQPLDDRAVATMSFSYLRERGVGFERTLWNCATLPRSVPAECMKRNIARVRVTPPATRPDALAGRPDALAGTRRRGDAPAPAPSPSPSPTPRQS
ncbi:MAG TPA: cell wall hydrolase [Sphingomonas sp.]|jgi:spore germination cell wall hydrolase CwlJ-like protein|nr:cell wall hydrolase [Sphingomonas sp.]